MARRIYNESIKKWAIISGISGVSIIFLIFSFLINQGIMDVHYSSGDMVCAGTEDDPCYAIINFTMKEDVFIYPTNYDPWGRDTPFEFDPAVKDWKLQRSWGTGWRNIPLDKPCTGTWCGLSNKDDTRKFSVVFREGKTYSIRIVGYKYNPEDRIKWSLNPEGEWLPSVKKTPYSFDLIMNCKNKTRTRYIYWDEELFIDCSFNASCPKSYYVNVTNFTIEEYQEEICKEVGVKVNNEEFMYKQDQVNCLRTNTILCCWDYRDGGEFLDNRGDEFRTEIRSGESGFCKDLNDSLKQTSYRSDWGHLELK